MSDQEAVERMQAMVKIAETATPSAHRVYAFSCGDAAALRIALIALATIKQEREMECAS